MEKAIFQILENLNHRLKDDQYCQGNNVLVNKHDLVEIMGIVNYTGTLVMYYKDSLERFGYVDGTAQQLIFKVLEKLDDDIFSTYTE